MFTKIVEIVACTQNTIIAFILDEKHCMQQLAFVKSKTKNNFSSKPPVLHTASCDSI